MPGGRYGDDPVATRITWAVNRRRTVGRDDLDRVRIDQASGAGHQIDPVPVDVRVDPFELQPADRVLPLKEPRDRHLGVQVDQQTVEVPLPMARQEQGGLTQGLRGQRARVDGGTAGLGLPLDDRDTLAEVGGLGGATFTGRAAADHHEVVGIAHGGKLRTVPGSGRSHPGDFRPTRVLPKTTVAAYDR